MALGVAPDFASDDGVVWIHRRDKSADWYFVARDNAEDKSFEASFRQTGRTPEIWNAETGAISDAKVWREEKGRTIVTLDFKPSGSAFVVFRRPATNRHLVSAKPLEVNCRPDPVLAEKPHTLVIKKAEYGVFGCGRPDCNSVAERIKPGVKVGVNNGAMGGDPAFGSIKQLEVRYTLDGKAKRDVASEGSHYTLPKNAKLSGASAVGHTDLLITWLFKMINGTEPKYYLASVVGILVFIVVAVISLIVYGILPSVKNEEDFQ